MVFDGEDDRDYGWFSTILVVDVHGFNKWGWCSTMLGSIDGSVDVYGCNRSCSKIVMAPSMSATSWRCLAGASSRLPYVGYVKRGCGG